MALSGISPTLFGGSEPVLGQEQLVPVGRFQEEIESTLQQFNARYDRCRRDFCRDPQSLNNARMSGDEVREDVRIEENHS